MNECTIVGFGIAGASFAWTCYLNNVSFRIVHNGKESSSHVAAGLVNPIVFKRLTKSWNADKLMPFAANFYQQIEEELDDQILSHKSIFRVFSSIEEQNNWASLQGDERFNQFMNPATDLHSNTIEANFGVGEIKTLGHLNTRQFLKLSRAFFERQNIKFLSDIEELTESTVIFCEGADVLSNPDFNYLPLKPTHGDVLTIKSSQLNIEDIINKNMFVLPLGDELFKVGATYNWDLKTNNPSEEGKNELIKKLKAFTNFEFELIKHEAGLRPTVSDRRPLIGQHPNKKNKYIFNGLGTKGVMIAPYYADQLLGHLLNGGQIDDEVSIKRYLKHFNA